MKTVPKIIKVGKREYSTKLIGISYILKQKMTSKKPENLSEYDLINSLSKYLQANFSFSRSEPIFRGIRIKR